MSTASGAFDVVCPPGVSASDEIEVELPGTSAEPSAEGDAALFTRIADFMEGDERYVQAIESFMAEHCGQVGHYSELRLDELNPQTREFPLEYHNLHHEYQALVEGLLGALRQNRLLDFAILSSISARRRSNSLSRQRTHREHARTR